MYQNHVTASAGVSPALAFIQPSLKFLQCNLTILAGGTLLAGSFAPFRKFFF
jgi:hypothetical protein